MLGVLKFASASLNLLLPAFARYLQVPVEASDVDTGGISVVKFQSVVVDDVDDWTHHGGRIAGDAIQKGLQPT